MRFANALFSPRFDLPPSNQLYIYNKTVLRIARQSAQFPTYRRSLLNHFSFSSSHPISPTTPTSTSTMSPFHLPSSLRMTPKVGKPSAQEAQQTPSLGEFELHVASVRAGTAPSAVTKFVEIPLDGPQKHVPLHIVIPKSTLTTSTVMEHDSDDDDDDDTKKSISLSPRSTKFGRYEEMFSPSSEQAASNEKIAVSSMEEQTLARLLFIYGFREYFPCLFFLFCRPS